MSRYVANAYCTVRKAGLVEGASPHALTMMLFDTGVLRIENARQHGKQCSLNERNRSIDKALAIVQELQGSLLEPETDPIAGNLFTLYSHIISQLLLANRSQQDEPLANSAELLGGLRDAWREIGGELPA